MPNDNDYDDNSRLRKRKGREGEEVEEKDSSGAASRMTLSRRMPMPNRVNFNSGGVASTQAGVREERHLGGLFGDHDQGNSGISRVHTTQGDFSSRTMPQSHSLVGMLRQFLPGVIESPQINTQQQQVDQPVVATGTSGATSSSNVLLGNMLQLLLGSNDTNIRNLLSQQLQASSQLQQQQQQHVANLLVGESRQSSFLPSTAGMQHSEQPPAQSQVISDILSVLASRQQDSSTRGRPPEEEQQIEHTLRSTASQNEAGQAAPCQQTDLNISLEQTTRGRQQQEAPQPYQSEANEQSLSLDVFLRGFINTQSQKQQNEKGYKMHSSDGASSRDISLGGRAAVALSGIGLANNPVGAVLGGEKDDTMVKIPCKARGMEFDHNPKSAFFQISRKMAMHGDPLICSHAACRTKGVRFLYCAYCEAPVAKGNFSSRHKHGATRKKKKNDKNHALQSQSTNESKNNSSNNIAAAGGGDHDDDGSGGDNDDNDGIPAGENGPPPSASRSLPAGGKGTMDNHGDEQSKQESVDSDKKLPTVPNAARKDMTGTSSSSPRREIVSRRQLQQHKDADEGDATSRSTTSASATSSDDGNTKKDDSDLEDDDESTTTTQRERDALFTHQRRKFWLALLDSRPNIQERDAMEEWLSRVLAASDPDIITSPSSHATGRSNEDTESPSGDSGAHTG